MGPFRGKKGEVHDGGIRSPFFMQWPARLKPGNTSDRLAAHIDVMPTLLDAAGVSVPKNLKLDGRSLLPLLEGRPVSWPDRTLAIQTHRGNVPLPYHHFAFRNERWMLVHPTGFGRQTPPDNVPFELYDLKQDPGQNTNLAEQRPEKLRELKRDYDAWFEDVSHTRPDNFAPPRIVVGTDHETRTVLTWEDWRVEGQSGWGHQGKWLLTFATEQTYDIEFLWPRKIKPATLELHIGSQRHTVQLKSATQKAVVKDVRVAPGQADLWAKIRRDGETEDPLPCGADQEIAGLQEFPNAECQMSTSDDLIHAMEHGNASLTCLPQMLSFRRSLGCPRRFPR